MNFIRWVFKDFLNLGGLSDMLVIVVLFEDSWSQSFIFLIQNRMFSWYLTESLLNLQVSSSRGNKAAAEPSFPGCCSFQSIFLHMLLIHAAEKFQLWFSFPQNWIPNLLAYIYCEQTGADFSCDFGRVVVRVLKPATFNLCLTVEIETSVVAAAKCCCICFNSMFNFNFTTVDLILISSRFATILAA